MMVVWWAGWLACAPAEQPTARVRPPPSLRASYGLGSTVVSSTGLSVVGGRVQVRFDSVGVEEVLSFLDGLGGHEVHTLDLHGVRLHGQLDRLARLEVLQGVELLRLGGPVLDDSDLADLASVELPALVELHLTDTSAGDLGLGALVESGHQPGLRVLGLRGNRIGPAGAGSLGRASWALEVLDLGCNPLGDDGAAGLAAGPLVTRLVWLDLGSTGTGPAGVEALAPHLGGLEVLSLWRNPMGHAGWQHLVNHPLALRELDASLTGLTFEDARLLCGHLRLEALFAYGNRVGDAALAVADCSALRTLDLGNNALGDEGIASLGPERLPHLEELMLWRNGITAEGSAGLASRFAGSSLLHLNLSYNEAIPR